MAEILFVVTGATHLTLADGTRHPTGFWAEEVVAPFEALTAAGHTVVVATPGGVVPTVDQASLSPALNGGQENADRITAALAAITELTKPISLDGVDLDDYAAVFYPGGHGPMEDLVHDSRSAELLRATLTSGKPLGVVCHGAAALLDARDAEGTWLFAGYRLTGFTRAEETQTGLADKVEWVLQDRLVESGALFEETAPWAPHVVVDRTLITGQNPASSAPVAAEMLKALG
ncbi:type 1 glutamine amidotransferase domain-containing protein [Streptomyces sp. NPDC057137]|uniref:type 1 glutamine amidotransferase domain-containing protein n=1 Tax=Streptomyces sp. NPDC057137 TaxID=3346030 RepID=UPI003632D09E